MGFIETLIPSSRQYQNWRNGVKALENLEINHAWPTSIPLFAPQKNSISLEQGKAHEYIL
jgi:hypothetical protein